MGYLARSTYYLAMLTARLTRSKIAKLSILSIVFSLVSVIQATEPAKAISATSVASMYVDAPFAQGSYARYYGGITESFDTFTSANSNVGTTYNSGTALSIGTVESGSFVVKQSAYYPAGASNTNETATVGGTQSKFGSTDATGFTISFTSPVKYVGFWWASGNATNYVSFYSGSDLIASLSTTDLFNLTGAHAPNPYSSDTTSLSSTDGNTYYKKYYFGNPANYSSQAPTSGASPDEPFAYVHAFATNGQSFDKIKISGDGFEFDNLTVSTQDVPIRNSLVFISDVQSNCSQSSNNDGNGVTTVRFTGTSLCSFNAPDGVTTVSIIAVGGGGGGGGVCVGGGGGAGGFYRNRELTVTGLIQIRVGSGGAGGGGSGCGGQRGATGDSTTVTMAGFSATARGGGGGGSNTTNFTGLNGASGGGGSGGGSYAGGTGVSGQGNSGGTGVNTGPGYSGAGGGGYSSSGGNGSGTNGGTGGSGVSLTIFGGTQHLAGGGGGASDRGAGTGGESCGGNGAGRDLGTAATAATGYGCGGGGGDGSYAATAGSAGVVFLSYTRSTNIKWDIQSKKTANAGSCGYGDFTQTVIGDPSGNFTIARFETKVEADTDPNGDGQNHQITDANCTFIVPKGVTSLTYLLVGGGGGGGYDGGGGGGGGQIREDTGFAVTEGETITVHIGAGGKGGGWWQSGTEALTYISSSCPVTESGAGIGHNGQGGADTYITRISNSSTVTAAGGGGGGGRCQKGLTTSRNSTSSNAGGNGHRYYVNSSDASGNCYLTDSCTYGAVDAVGAGLSQGGKGNSHQGGGGGGAGAVGGNATYRYLSNASGGNGSARFANNPIISGTYGGGGGGGTYCKYSTDPYGGTTYCNGINWIDFNVALGGNSGGDGGTGLGSATSSGTKSTGGGGGGAGGYGTIKGGYGSGGIAFLMWKVPLAVSGASIAVKRTIVSGTDTITAGTMSLLQAPLYDTGSVSCGPFKQKTTFTMVNDSATVWSVKDSVTVTSSQLSRGYCYTWSEDPNFGTSSTASAPTTNTFNVFGNLTSPILILPNRPDVKIPKIIPADPRRQSINLGSVKVSQGSGKVQACFFENDGSTITGNQGVARNSQNLLFSSSVAIDTQTSGNTNQEFRWVYSTIANNALRDVLTNLSMTRYNATRFSVDRYVLIRLAPYLNGDYVTDCIGTLTGNTTAYTSDLAPTDSDVYLVRLRPITLVSKRTVVVAVKK